ncbi:MULTISPECIES: cytochrome C biogenesis protein [Glaesserella]|uniref:Cytochrome C biogenesis protein n=1 Tax=Glaesserella australis TaxID=2094024 RepID=A0A328BYP2_9PAST|nr:MULTISPECIES: cytochrome C biogenesis protein [Glaesserella]AUI66443.1 cytochrome C biogenesis protein [Glaesserella sp. 15-184]RAL19343.1 cytochrome C biogenesis protein [Glaesserella australis]
MNNRDHINQTYYQKAAQLAQHLSTQERDEFLAELNARQQFEQCQPKDHLQKNTLKRPLVIMALFLILLLSGLFYWQTGRYDVVQHGQTAFQHFKQQRAEESSEQRNQHYITHLQDQLRQDSNNGERWFELGQAYSLNNDFESALICFRNAQTVLGEKATILGAMATADYYLNKQQFTPQSKAWLDRALQLDSRESASLLLLASDAFFRNDFKQAIFYWESVLDNENNPALDRREIIKSIKMAEQMLKAGK